MEFDFKEELKFIMIKWEDSAHISFGWSPLDNIKDQFVDKIHCISVGILLDETKDYIVIAQSGDVELTAVSNILKIPRNSIIKTKELKAKK